MTEQTRNIREPITAMHRTNGSELQGVPSRHRRYWLRLFLCLLAGIALIGSALFVSVDFPVFSGRTALISENKLTRQQPDMAQQKQLQKASMNLTEAADPFLAHARQVGANTCSATYADLGKALTEGTQFMVQTQAAKTDIDRHALQGIVGMIFGSSLDGNYTGPAAGLVYAAPTIEGCEGTMVRVVPFAQSCASTAALLPNDSQQQQSLSGLPVFALSSGGQAMLMPAGSGCIAISIVRSST